MSKNKTMLSFDANANANERECECRRLSFCVPVPHCASSHDDGVSCSAAVEIHRYISIVCELVSLCVACILGTRSLTLKSCYVVHINEAVSSPNIPLDSSGVNECRASILRFHFHSCYRFPKSNPNTYTKR